MPTTIEAVIVRFKRSARRLPKVPATCTRSGGPIKRALAVPANALPPPFLFSRARRGSTDEQTLFSFSSCLSGYLELEDGRDAEAATAARATPLAAAHPAVRLALDAEWTPALHAGPNDGVPSNANANGRHADVQSSRHALTNAHATRLRLSTARPRRTTTHGPPRAPFTRA